MHEAAQKPPSKIYPVSIALAVRGPMVRVLLALLVSLTFSSVAYSEPVRDQEAPLAHHHPVLPIVLGMALITWGAYELGDDTEDGQRNVSILWGGALVVSACIVLYQEHRDKGARLAVHLNPDREHMLAFDYRF